MTDLIAKSPLGAAVSGRAEPSAGAAEASRATDTRRVASARRTGSRMAGAGPREAPGKEKSVSEALRHLNGMMQSIRRELHFSVDRESGRTIIKVIDAETDEVIRQIPPDEAESVARTLSRGALTRGFTA